MLLSKAAPSLFMFGIDLTQLQHLALGLVGLCEVCTGQPLKPAKVHLEGKNLGCGLFIYLFFES